MTHLRRLTLLTIFPLGLLTSVAPLASPAQLFVTPPPGAPTSKCVVTPSGDIATLRIIQGAKPLTEVLACGVREPGKCVADRFTPGTRWLPSDSVAEFDHSEGDWSCVALNGDAMWVPTDRLAPLPAQPAVPASFWIGWWRRQQEVPGRRNDRLLIVPGSKPGQLHISGRAYWYGLGDDVHFGSIDTNASIYGPYLHAVEGSSPGACVLDLVANTATRTVTGFDNENCGGMNVRFWGKWTRFTPSTPPHK